MEGLLGISTLFLLSTVAEHYTHINTCYVLLTVPLYTMLSTTNDQNIPNLGAIVDCTHVGSATASFKDLVTLHRRAL